jgi:alpha-methylacyl-CoA racemase
MPGPLEGYRIVELAGIGPGPFCGMMLADHGAEVIRVDRLGGTGGGIDSHAAMDPLQRSRKSIAVDLKRADGIKIVRDLCRTADGLIEGFRPGVMERLGLGPDVLQADNARLVYGRMTGWGQSGPYAKVAGHDINYIALAGALHAFGRAGEKPTPPVNMVGDFGGGGMILAFGMVSAILAAQKSGHGQVIDCAMVDGSALLMSMIWGFRAQGLWQDERGVNALDTGAHFYDTYECADGRFVAIGAIEPQFYAELRRLAGIADESAFDAQHDRAAWPSLKEEMTRVCKTKSRDEWCAVMEMTDACFAPVLSMGEAPGHPHNIERATFGSIGDAVQPMPAPRYSSTPTAIPRPAGKAGADGEALLIELGYDAAHIVDLRAAGTPG